jgi:hypothetical protein
MAKYAEIVRSDVVTRVRTHDSQLCEFGRLPFQPRQKKIISFFYYIIHFLKNKQNLYS